MSREDIQAIVDSAINEAISRRHEFITVEHLLYSILLHGTGYDIIDNCDGDVDELINELIDFFSDKIPEIPANLISTKIPAQETDKNESTQKEIMPMQTIGFQRVLERAMTHVINAGKTNIEIGDVLASICLEQDSFAVYMLK